MAAAPAAPYHDVLSLLRGGELVAAARAQASGAGEAQHAERVLARLQQLGHGRNTLGYQAYRLRVPRAKRRREDPATPLADDDRSKRSFGEAVKVWRRALHRHFPAGGSGGGGSGRGGEGGEEEEAETVVRLADGRARARVLPGTHAGTGGALPALLRLVYGGCRREAVGAAAERAAAGRAAWERAAAAAAATAATAAAAQAPAPPALPALPRAGAPAAAALAPGPQGPAAGFTVWDEGAAGEPEALARAWQWALAGCGGGGGGAQAGAPLDPQQVQALVQRALQLQPTTGPARRTLYRSRY
jgi:hypothetical protein